VLSYYSYLVLNLVVIRLNQVTYTPAVRSGLPDMSTPGSPILFDCDNDNSQAVNSELERELPVRPCVGGLVITYRAWPKK